MGHALGLVHALGGCDVTVQDVSPEVLAAAPGLVAAALETLVETGDLRKAEAQAARGRIRYLPDLAEAVAGADLIVEAVVESKAVKQELFVRLDALSPEDAIWASNTSHLDVFPLIPDARQSRAAIAHWYTPPYLIDLVDIAPGPSTDRGVIDLLDRFYRGMGKAPVIFDRLVPGYVANRLQMALNLECLRMIEEGWVGPEEIDRSIRHGLVARMAVLGHMRKMDFTGLQMVQNGLSGAAYRPPRHCAASPVLQDLLDRGRSGVRAGGGFYDYGDQGAERHFRRRDRRIVQMKQALVRILGEEDG